MQSSLWSSIRTFKHNVWPPSKEMHKPFFQNSHAVWCLESNEVWYASCNTFVSFLFPYIYSPFKTFLYDLVEEARGSRKVPGISWWVHGIIKSFPLSRTSGVTFWGAMESSSRSRELTAHGGPRSARTRAAIILGSPQHGCRARGQMMRLAACEFFRQPLYITWWS